MMPAWYTRIVAERIALPPSVNRVLTGQRGRYQRTHHLTLVARERNHDQQPDPDE